MFLAHLGAPEDEHLLRADQEEQVTSDVQFPSFPAAQSIYYILSLFKELYTCACDLCDDA